jgi:outer membrane receptor protein involved in Fe transport
MPSSIWRAACTAALCCFIAFPALAQRPAGPPDRAAMQERAGQMAPGVVLGSVRDAETGEAISGATVAIWRNGSLVTGAVTDARGAFRIEQLRPATYRVVVSFLGYAEAEFAEVALAREAPVVDLGVVRLAPDMAQLEAIEVAGEREMVEIRADRTVYNVRDEPVAETGSATDVLEQLPSVEVDIDGNVSLRGNQNVAILLNGRAVPVSGPFLASFLRQLPANSIERIEVIPNPSARYNPEGMGGIINIVTRQDTDLGLSGGVTIGGGTTGRYSAGANVAYQAGRLSAAASYGLRRDVRTSEGFTFRENRYLDRLGADQPEARFLDQTSFNERTGASHLLNGNVDYRFGQSTTLGLTGLLSIRDGVTEAANDYLFFRPDQSVVRHYLRGTEGSSDGLTGDLALTLRHVFEAGTHELSAEARVNRSTNDDHEVFRRQDLVDASGEAPGEPTFEVNTLERRASDATLQVDYNRPLPVGLALETGYRGTFRGLDNTFTAEPRTQLSNAFTFDETVHAAYGLLTRSFGALETKAGARVEAASTAFTLANTGETFENDYLSVFPSAFLLYRLSQTRQLRASYGLRVDRPRTRVLNPFTTFEDPLNIRRGNPYLLPEYTHSVEAGYAQFTTWGSLQLTPYYRHTRNAIGQHKTVDTETGVSTTTFENFATRDSYGAEVVLTARPAEWLSGFVSFNGYRAVTDAGNLDASLGTDALGWNARGNLQLQLPYGLALQGFGMYRSPRAVPNGRISSFTMTNLSLRKRLLDDRGTLTLQVRDVFDTMGFSFMLDDADFYQLAERKPDSRVVSLAFTYTFGQAPRQRGGRGRDQRTSPEQESPDADVEIGID